MYRPGIHFGTDPNIDIEVLEIFPGDESVESVSSVNIEGVSLVFYAKQAEKLCEKLEEFLYDEPTYKQLSDEVSSLINQIDELKEELAELKSRHEERHVSYRGVI